MTQTSFGYRKTENWAKVYFLFMEWNVQHSLAIVPEVCKKNSNKHKPRGYGCESSLPQMAIWLELQIIFIWISYRHSKNTLSLVFLFYDTVCLICILSLSKSKRFATFVCKSFSPARKMWGQQTLFYIPRIQLNDPWALCEEITCVELIGLLSLS